MTYRIFAWHIGTWVLYTERLGLRQRRRTLCGCDGAEKRHLGGQFLECKPNTKAVSRPITVVVAIEQPRTQEASYGDQGNPESE